MKKLKYAASGFFITIEGPDGSGKSTQIKRLQTYLVSCGFDCLLTREPGGTPLAEELRKLLKSFYNEHEKVCDGTELLLMEAARMQHVTNVIKPAVASGKIVLCDRFFDSTTAYQGGARGIDMETIGYLNRFAVNGCIPDLTLLLDLPPEIGFARASTRQETKSSYDRFEAEKLMFHQKVRQTFLSLAQQEPGRIKVINANQEAEKVECDIRRVIDEYIV